MLARGTYVTPLTGCPEKTVKRTGGKEAGDCACNAPHNNANIPHPSPTAKYRRASAIAAASIVAKVTRDRMMIELHATDPRYGYDRHKGYATADHLAAVARHGYSTLHRRSFKPQGSLFDTID